MGVDRRSSWAGLFALAMTVGAVPASAQSTSTNYDELYNRYLTSARRTPEANRSLWMVDMAADLRARQVNDIVTIRVVENLTASGSADANLDKSGSAVVALPSGHVADALARAFPVASDTEFTGSGGTTRATTLQAVVTARVIEVLPSGDLVVEGVREIDINGDRSVVVLSGVIRAVDIQPGNVILSTRVGQLRIRSLSAGLIRDSLSPGWLIKLLNKVF